MDVRSLVIALLLLPLAGCVDLSGATRSCEEPYPLVLQAYPQVTNTSNYQFQSVLWNCTPHEIPVDDPCQLRNGVMPRLTVEDTDYYIGMLNRSAKLPNQLWCDPNMPERAMASEGAWLEQHFYWDGTYIPEGADLPQPVPPGEYTVSIRADSWEASQVVRVPW